MRGTEVMRERTRFTDSGQTASAPSHRSRVELPVIGNVPNTVAIGVVGLIVLLVVFQAGGGESRGVEVRDIQ